MNEARKNLAAIAAKAKHLVEEERKLHPNAHVRSVALQTAVSVREAEKEQALKRMPTPGLPIPNSGANEVKDAEVIFVSVTGIADDSQAGKLLTSIVQAMGLSRQNVAVTMPEQLEKQLIQKKPKALVALGVGATQALLRSTDGMEKLRGRFSEFQGIPVMPTHHPVDLLNDSRLKRNVWEDMKQVVAKIKA